MDLKKKNFIHLFETECTQPGVGGRRGRQTGRSRHPTEQAAGHGAQSQDTKIRT